MRVLVERRGLAPDGPGREGKVAEQAQPAQTPAKPTEGGAGGAGGQLHRLARDIRPSTMADVGFVIPWNQRLGVRMLGGIVAASLATVVSFAIAEYRVQGRLQDQVAEESDLISSTIRKAIHRTMLQDRRPDAYVIMEDVARQEGIEKVRMMDASGRVTFSTDRGEIGDLVDRKAEACSLCHAEGAPLSHPSLKERTRMFQGPDHRVLGIVAPLYNEESCSSAACHAHPPSRKVLGVLDVELSLARVDDAALAFRWRSLAVAAVIAFLLGLGFWFFTRAHVVTPVASLVQATRRVARDQLDIEIPVTWSGELGLLATSFNDMTRSLRATEEELKAFTADLERKVEERTAALRTAQDQLVRSEKLSSLGKLSASIAHEINNPLAGILTFAKLLVRTLDAGTPDDATRRTLVKNLHLVEREAERCTAIVRNLLDFARERPLAVAEIDPAGVVEEALQLLANQLAIQNVRVERNSQPLPKVEGDFGQLRQAIVNVIMNACEAMALGGKLTIDTTALEGGAGVEIAISDSGPGIPPEVLKRVFDPFFTTKEKGTGLGLSVVYGIVERHGGRIDLKSEVGKGTRVAIRLPLHAGEERRA
jgi:two-component system NtrC family sensor kinase